MTHPLLILCLFAFAGLPGEPVLHRPVPERRTAADFERALETKVSASLRNVELRTILNRLAEEHKTSVILDRTIDPTQELELDITFQPLKAAFGTVANSVGAELCILGNTLYIGPPKRVAKLRTLEHLRAQEQIALAPRLPKGRSLALSQTNTVHWNDLDEPRRLVRDLADEARIEIQNPEVIPHDLWASGTLPKDTLTEGLSLILIQFDLTFSWNQDGSQIRLVPVPEIVAVEKPYTPAGGPSLRASRTARQRFLENAAKTLAQQHEGISCKVDVDKNRLLIAATLEQHEILSGSEPAKAVANSPKDKTPTLKNRQFTLRIERVPASALMKKLEETGIKFAYDPDQLAAKNINLDDPISLDVKQADADEFFEAFCAPLGLNFSIENVTVTLTPK